MKTQVYVDGFNLYYGAVKGTPYKWLNIYRMCELLLPINEIVGIKYFTAEISARPGDPQKPNRQQVFLRALRTLPNFEIILGHYLSHKVTMPVANPRRGQPRFVEVIKTEEKGSDVNMATHMLQDGFQGNYELAVLVSNDSDLLTPIQVIQRDLGLKVGVINPQQHPSKALRNEVLFMKKIRAGVLKAAQFAETLTDAKGSFHKPEEW